MAALGDFFAALPLQTRYQRFFAPVRPTPALLRVLSGGGANVDAMVAVRDGVIIGHGMAADRPGTEGSRRPGAPQDPHELAVTDIGVVVADTWQGRGVGSALVHVLVIRAQARGVTSLTMDVLHANRRALSMIRRRWPAAEIDHSREHATIHVRLPRSERLPWWRTERWLRCGGEGLRGQGDAEGDEAEPRDDIDGRSTCNYARINPMMPSRPRSTTCRPSPRPTTSPAASTICCEQISRTPPAWTGCCANSSAASGWPPPAPG